MSKGTGVYDCTCGQAVGGSELGAASALTWVIGPDGTVYTLNGGTIFALGGVNGISVQLSSSTPDLRSVVLGQSLTFTYTETAFSKMRSRWPFHRLCGRKSMNNNSSASG